MSLGLEHLQSPLFCLPRGQHGCLSVETILERIRKPSVAVLCPGVREKVLLRMEMEICIWQDEPEMLSAEV